MEHIVRDIVSNGDTFRFAKLIEEEGEEEKYDIIKIRDSIYGSLLHVAVEYNQIEMFRMLIDYGMNINCKSSEITLENSCLHEAVNKNNINMVDCILELNGDINIVNNLGLTPLALATLKGHSKIALYLLSKNADPTIEDNQGKTPYIHAKENGNYKLLQHLPEKQWSLDNDPKWKALIHSKINTKNDDNKVKKSKKGKKGKKSKKGKKKK